jgi:hypothetical protein
MRHSCTLSAHVMVLALGTVCAIAQVRQAEYQIHDRGQLWETMKDNGTIGAPNPTNRFEFLPSMDWPGGPHTLTSKDEQRSYNYAAGMWIGGKKAGGQIFFTENGPGTLVDNGTFSPITKSTNYVGSPSYNPSEAEEIISAEWTTTENMRVKRISRAWSVPGCQNVILLEYLVTNQTTSSLTDVYIGFPYLLRPNYQDFVVHNGWGDALNRADDLVRYDAAQQLLYSYDDLPSYSIPSDVGNYWSKVDELRATGYAGVGLVYADPVTGGSTQPANVLYAQYLGNERNLTLSSVTPAQLYNVLSGADRTLQAQPDERLVPFALMACGPYTLAPGGSVKIVLVHAVNGMPLADAVQGLSMQPYLPSGADSLRASVARARALYASNYRLPAVPPPSPNAEYIPLPSSKSISLTWPALELSYVNPVTGARNIQGYRIYRSKRGFIGPFELTWEIEVEKSIDRSRYFNAQLSQWKVLDNAIDLGVSYFYAVTTFDSLLNEGGFTNRNESGITATAPPASSVLNVKVFPNPFRDVSGFPTSGEENSIVWAYLPEKATVRIFTASGDLVKTIKHESATSGQAVWDQVSDARQRVASGIYFWTVESPVGSTRGTLVIIK